VPGRPIFLPKMQNPHLATGLTARMACCAFLAASALPSLASLTNRWSFNNTAGAAVSGTAVTDSIAGAAAAVRGNGSTFTGNGLTITGATTGNQNAATISGYVDLPNGIFSSKTNLSIEIWASPLSYLPNARMFDFGRVSTAGNGSAPGEIVDATTAPGANLAPSQAIYVNFCLNSISTQRMKSWYNGLQVNQNDSALATTAGTQYHYVFTFEDGVGTYGATGGRITWFRNGVQVTTADVNFRLQNIQDVNNWLGRSNFSNDSLSNANYNEVRLYNHVLSAAEISANLTAGPDTLVDPPAPVDPPVPDHLWKFTTTANSNAPSGQTFTDETGGLPAVLRGNGGSLTGGAVVLPGTTTGNQPSTTISAYVDLPNGCVTETQSVSFEAWATPLSSKNWARLFDFGRCVTTSGTGAATGEIVDGPAAPGAFVAYDNLSLTFNNAANINSQQLEGQTDGGAMQYSFSNATTTIGTKYHYVFVVEDKPTGCQARWYRNGVLQNSMDFTWHLDSMEDVNNWIGRSMYAGDSNSHMSLDELRIYRKAITLGEIQASYAAGPDPAIGPPEPPTPAPVPSRRWNFTATVGNAASGMQFADIATGEIATVRGIGGTLTGTALVFPGAPTNGNQTAETISAYLDLPNGIVSSRPSATYEAWLTPLSSKNWQRVFDFGGASVTSGTGASTGEVIDGPALPGNFTSSDNLFLSLNNGNTLGSSRIEAKNDGGNVVALNTDLSGSTQVNTPYHFTMTIQDGGGASGASGCLVKWYRNGTLGGTIDVPYRMTDISDVNNWIGRSMWATDSNANYSLDELRIYDRAISPAEVTASYAAGPDADFTAPVASNDAATIHAGQKALIDVLANDTGSPLGAALQILSPPATGTATVSNGKILYTHPGGSTSPVTFTYRVGNVSGATADAMVTVNISNNLRITNPALAMPGGPPATDWQLVDALPGLTFAEPIVITSAPGNTKRLFVCERMAKIRLVPDVTAAAPTQSIFLNLQTTIAGRTPAETIEGGANAEHGLLGLAFHPQYATNGYFYVAYTVRINGGTFYQRISRFQVSADPAVANPNSELILLQQLDEGPNHDGGDLHFGPNDGYLYYTAGDEENANDFRLNSQRINKDFFCGVFRIDVDKKPGNLAPNPHAAIPTDNGVARFSVPWDNPFVHTTLGGPWTGTYNGVAVTPLSGVRTEFWATGLRHTWRMSFDAVTGDLWGGDVGQNTYEEVNKIVKGGNYGWVYREGKHDTAFTNPVPPTKPTGFTSIDPAYEYIHNAIAGGDTNFKGNSVVGGYVYRGTRYPSLVGTYIFSDSVSGHVWQMNTTTGATNRLTGLPGAYGVISTQGVDPSNKDLLFGAYLTGKIMRLKAGDNSNDGFPRTLTATGLFSDLTDLSPSPGLLPYQPNLAFWSDHAIKRRWFTIPNAGGMMSYNKEGNWTYPTGTVWVKHFDLEMSRGNPATKKRIETRVIVKTDTGSYGVSYRWNEAQTEATLVEDAGAEFDLSIDDHGTPHTQRWQIPGRTSCLTCHTPQAGHALSFNTRQLNLVNTMNGFSGNQIDLLSNHGFLSNTPPSPSILPRHVRADETAFPLEQRARSYFAVNCAYCHQAGGSVSGFWDGRAQLTLEETGLINGNAENNGGNPANKYIVPGDTTHSIILNRMAATNGFNRMPPLGSTEVDPADIALVTEWINSSLPGRPLYQQWRDTYFAALDSNGAKTADPDGDGVTNYNEYLQGSSPLGGTNWQAGISDGMLQFTRKSHRYYSIQTSDDLGTWHAWSIPELENTYLSNDTATEVPLPVDPDGKQFYRFHVEEP